MKIATWNVNGIRARMEQVAAWMAAEKPDVVCLQEIKASPDQLGDTLFALADYVNYWHGAKGGYSGVSLHIRRGAFEATPVFTHPDLDMETRIAVVEVGDLQIASVYVPNGGKDFEAKLTFLGELAAWTAKVTANGKQLIVCGDLNVAVADIDVHSSQRSVDTIGQRPEERGLFARMFAAGLVDVQRKLAPDDDKIFTWWPYWRQARERNLGWRIDYVLASKAIADRVTAMKVQREVGTSDHAPVVVEWEP